MLAFLPWRHASNDICSIGDAVFGIAGCDAAGEALVDDTGVLADLEVVHGVLVTSGEGGGGEMSFATLPREVGESSAEGWGMP